MNITKKENGDALEVALQGRLDTMTTPQLEQELKSCSTSPPPACGCCCRRRSR